MTVLDEDFSVATSDPSVLAAAEALTSEDTPPVLTDPLDGPVTLPAGFRRVHVSEAGTQFEDVRKAWIRELNGEDEEKIARTKLKNDVDAFVTAILECGVEKLGDSTPTKKDFESLVIGDQQYLLMEIARVTYGDEVSYEKYVCPFCREEFDVSISLADDVKVIRLPDIEAATFEVPLKKDRVARVNLPTVEVSKLASKEETDAAANTVIITQCVEEIRGPSGSQAIQGDVAAVRRLGLADRQALVVAMGDKMPGPRYNEVTFDHEPGCGSEVRLQVTLADLFRGL